MTHLSTTTNNHLNHKVHANHTITKGIAASLLAMATLLPFTSVSAATYPSRTGLLSNVRGISFTYGSHQLW